MRGGALQAAILASVTAELAKQSPLIAKAMREVMVASSDFPVGPARIESGRRGGELRDSFYVRWSGDGLRFEAGSDKEYASYLDDPQNGAYTISRSGGKALRWYNPYGAGASSGEAVYRASVTHRGPVTRRHDGWLRKVASVPGTAIAIREAIGDVEVTI